MKAQELALFPRRLGVFAAPKLSRKMLDVTGEIIKTITDIDLCDVMTKVSKEKTMMGQTLVSPRDLNFGIREGLLSRGWDEGVKLKINYAVGDKGNGSREVDFIKDRVGCEVQFGKYAFTHYDALKLQMFQKAGIIDLGVLVIPTKTLQAQMSSGCPCFDGVVHDFDYLEYDKPLLVVGIE